MEEGWGCHVLCWPFWKCIGKARGKSRQSGAGQECPATQPGHDGTIASEKVTLILHLLCCEVPGTSSALPHLGCPAPPRASRENTLSAKHRRPPVTLESRQTYSFTETTVKWGVICLQSHCKTDLAFSVRDPRGMGGRGAEFVSL